MKKEAVWFMLSLALGIIWSFLAAYFLGRIMSSGVYILVFFLTIPLCAIVYDTLSKGKKITQVTCLIILTASGTLLGGIHIGLFESMSLAEDSFIDISNCVIALHVRNTGLSDIQIAKVTVSNINFNMNRYYPPYLAIGTDAYLMIDYASRMSHWDPTPDKPIGEYDYSEATYIASDIEATPLTFQNGSIYSITFHTYSLFQHSFSLKAELTAEEGLDILKKSSQEENQRVNISFDFNNTGASQCYIYTIQVGTVTFQVKPPFLVWKGWSGYYSQRISISIGEMFHGGFNYIIQRSGWGQSEMTAEPTPTVSMFQKNETYNVTFRTMANNYYTFNITIT